MQTLHIFFVRRAFLAIFLLALAVRIALVAATASYLITENTEVVLIARSLAETGEFANPFGHGGPTAHSAPLYPMALSVLFRLFGTGTAGNFAQETLASGLTALMFASFPASAVRLGLSRGVGLAAGYIGALLPVQFWNQTKGSSETAALALALLWCVTLHVASIREKRAGWVESAKLGLAWGIAATISPIVLAMFGLLLMYSLASEPDRTALSAASVASLAVLLCLAPWAIRNRIALGHWIWTRSNLGLELYIANNPTAAPDFDTNTMTPTGRQHPHVSTAEALLVRAMGEYEYNQAKREAALEWIAAHPGAFLTLTAQRFYLFWLPTMPRPLQELLVRVQALLGLIGLGWLTWRSRSIAAPFWIVFAAYPLLYYVVQASARYRYPVDPFLLLLAVYLAWEVGEKLAPPNLTNRAAPATPQPPASRTTP